MTLRPFARALQQGDIARARVLWEATTGRLGLLPLPDHDGELFEGVLVPREEPVSPSAAADLARSWERLDRAYAPCEDAELTTEVRDLVRELARTTGLTADLGEDHLFVVLGSRGEARALARFTGDEWRALVGDAPTDGRPAEVFRTQRDLFVP